MQDLIYDWNEDKKPQQKLEFDDETLRDGLQSPSVTIPSVDDRIKMLHLMDKIGLDTADIGLPGAGGAVKQDTLALAQEIAKAKLKVKPNCAARTLEVDIAPVVEIVQKTGQPIETCLFIGSSPIRRYAEEWPIETMLEHTRKAVSFATKNNLPVMYVTEDTTRAKPEDLEKLYLTAIECGAARICLADTVGHVTPIGTMRLVRFIKEMLKKKGLERIKVDFHGHMDRGLGVWNAICAFMAGADRVHGTILGIGERVGNAPLDLLLVNLKLMGWIDNDLSSLADYCEIVSRTVEVPIPKGYPVFGDDAFATATGVHAAAVIKALNRKDTWLADRVYSSVPASWFGRKQSIQIGPMSGKSNVIFYLESRGKKAPEELVTKILNHAKQSSRVLTEEEINNLCK